MRKHFVLIGGGHASVSAARTLRRLDFDGHITIVGTEEHLPYQRPPLSKDWLLGNESTNDILSASADWFEANDVELELKTTAEQIELKELRVHLSNGKTLDADAILIATGARPRILEGTENLKSAFYLRSIDDADKIKAQFSSSRHVVIVGGGFIGLEVAASARAAGLEVTLLESSELPLKKILGQDVASTLTDIHKQQGVDIRVNESVTSVTDSDSGVRVETERGTTIEADFAVIGIGVIPNDEIARSSEITVGNGIRVDEYCRSSAPGVFAAGDVANFYHPGFDKRMRVEHFDNATRQATVAAKNMMGIRTEISDAQWFWSDQYDHNFQYAGHATRWDTVVFRGSLDDHDFSAFYLQDEMLVAAFGANRGADVMQAKNLITSKIKLNVDRLRDSSVELGDLSAERDREPVTAADSDNDVVPSTDSQGFTRAARSGQVTEGHARRFTVEGVEVAIARSNGKVYAVHNLCTHLACHLASGQVEDGCLSCLCHGSVFDLATGVPLNPPATKAVQTYPVHETDGQIYVAVK